MTQIGGGGEQFTFVASEIKTLTFFFSFFNIYVQVNNL